MRYIFIFLTGLFLTGCASQVPQSIRFEPESEIDYQRASQDIDSAIGKTVRWGGRIISVENKSNASWIEILLTPLGLFGEPELAADDKATGRFIAKIEGFVEPEVYSKGRSLTVFGTIGGIHRGKVDQHPYRYPLVDVQEYYLWPKYPASYQRYVPYPYFYYGASPFYRRYYWPGYGYPYYRLPYYRFRLKHYGR